MRTGKGGTQRAAKGGLGGSHTWLWISQLRPFSSNADCRSRVATASAKATFDPDNEALSALVRVQRVYNIFRPGDLVFDVGCMPGVASRFLVCCVAAAPSASSPEGLSMHRHKRHRCQRDAALEGLLDSIDFESSQVPQIGGAASSSSCDSPQSGVVIGVDQMCPSKIVKDPSTPTNLFAGAHFIHSSVEALSNNPAQLHAVLQGLRTNNSGFTSQYSPSPAVVREAFGSVDVVYVDLGSLSDRDVMSAGRQLLSLPVHKHKTPEEKRRLIADALGPFSRKLGGDKTEPMVEDNMLVSSERVHKQLLFERQRKAQSKSVLPTLSPAEVALNPKQLGLSSFKDVEVRDPTVKSKRLDSANLMTTCNAMVASMATGDSVDDTQGDGATTIEVPLSMSSLHYPVNSTSKEVAVGSGSEFHDAQREWVIQRSSSIFSNTMIAARTLHSDVVVSPDSLMRFDVAKQIDSLEHALRVFAPMLRKWTEVDDIRIIKRAASSSTSSSTLPKSVTHGAGGRMLFRLLLPSTSTDKADVPFETSSAFSRFVDLVKGRFSFVDVVDRRWILADEESAEGSGGTTALLQLMVLACNAGPCTPNEQKQLPRAEKDNPATLLLFNESIRKQIAAARASAALGSADDMSSLLHDMPRPRHPSQPLGKHTNVEEMSKLKNFRGVYKTFNSAGGTSVESVIGGGGRNFKHSQWSPISGFRRRESPNAGRVMGSGQPVDTSRLRNHKSPFFTTTATSATKAITSTTSNRLGRTSMLESPTTFRSTSLPKFAQAPSKEELLLRARQQGAKEDRDDRFNEEFTRVKRSILFNGGFDRDYNE